MKRISVYGTSIQKIADEAQLIAVSKILTSRVPEARLTIFTKYGNLLAEILVKENLQVNTLRTSQLGRIIRELARCDLFVMVGGPFYEAPSQAVKCFLLFSIAKMLRRPVMSYGTSFFPLNTWWGRPLFRNIFNRMDAITVREPMGLQVLRDLGVKKEAALFADPRFVLDPASPDEARDILVEEGVDPEQPIIAITTRHLHQSVPGWVKRSHQYAEHWADNANEVMSRIVAFLGGLGQLVLIPMHPSYTDDLEMAALINRHLGEKPGLKILSRRYDSRVVMGLISQCELLFASRLGSAIFATVTGTPVVAIAYEPRMQDHMNRVGLDRYVFDWKGLNYDDVIAKIEEVWSSRNAIREQMKARAEEFEEMAWNNAEIVNALLYTSRASEFPTGSG